MVSTTISSDTEDSPVKNTKIEHKGLHRYSQIHAHNNSLKIGTDGRGPIG